MIAEYDCGCKNGGRCHKITGECICKDGYYGTKCETFDYCSFYENEMGYLPCYGAGNHMLNLYREAPPPHSESFYSTLAFINDTQEAFLKMTFLLQ